MSAVTMADPRRTMRDLTDALRRGAADVDERRAISPEVSQMLKDAGVFALLAPTRIGGAEVDPLTFFDVVEQASYADGSVGWIVMIGGCYATFGGMLPPAARRGDLRRPARRSRPARSAPTGRPSRSTAGTGSPGGGRRGAGRATPTGSSAAR